MNTSDMHELEIDRQELQRIVEHEMALSACEDLLKCASTVEESSRRYLWISNLSRCFKRNDSKPETLELSDVEILSSRLLKDMHGFG